MRKLLRKGVFRQIDQAVGDEAVDSERLPTAMTSGAVPSDFNTDQYAFR